MALSLAKSTWSSLERLLYTQLNAVTAELLKAIDGTGGGTYTPSAVLSIQGSNGLEVAGSGTAARLKLGSRSLTRLIPRANGHSVSQWTRVNVSGNDNVWQHGSGASAGLLVWELGDLPNTNVLDSVTCRYDGSTSGTLPAVMPTLSVWRVDKDGTETQIGGTTNDPSASDAAYTVPHDIAVSSLAHTIDRSAYRYFAKVTGGTGGGSTSGSLALQMLAQCTVTSQAEW